MLLLSENDLQELNKFIQELPLKHGLPLLNFLNAKITEQTKQKQEAEQAIQKEEKPE